MTQRFLQLDQGDPVRERVATVSTAIGDQAAFEIRMLAAEAVERINRSIGQRVRRMREISATNRLNAS